MNFDREGASCAALVILVVLGLVVGVWLLGEAWQAKASADNAQARVIAAETERARVDYAHREYMYILWTTWLEHKTGNFGPLDLVGALALVGLILAGGYALGLLLPNDWIHRGD